MKDEKVATASKVGGITQNIDLGYACFQGSIVGYVSLDSHAEYVQFATAARLELS